MDANKIIISNRIAKVDVKIFKLEHKLNNVDNKISKLKVERNMIEYELLLFHRERDILDNNNNDNKKSELIKLQGRMIHCGETEE